MEILPLFCEIDDFCKVSERFYQRKALSDGKRRKRATRLSQAEVMTILVMYHASDYTRIWKPFIYGRSCGGTAQIFAGCAVIKDLSNCSRDAWCRCFSIFCVSAGTARAFHFGNSTGISFIDATALKVCHNLRIPSPKVFKGSAARGKSSTGWYYGFKLHLAVNEKGEILGFYITAANIDERAAADWITQDCSGKLVGDKGCLSKTLFEQLMARGLKLITKLRRNMKNRFMEMEDKLLLRKRAIIETINDQLKNISNIEHTRHRSLWNFSGNVASGLIAYCWKEKKPSLNLNFKDLVSFVG